MEARTHVSQRREVPPESQMSFLRPRYGSTQNESSTTRSIQQRKEVESQNREGLVGITTQNLPLGMKGYDPPKNSRVYYATRFNRSG